MTPPDFERLKAAALAVGAEARTELVAELLDLSPTQLARHNPAFWAQITPGGRERLLAGLVGEAPAAAPPRASTKPPRRIASTAFSTWETWPPAVRAVVVGAASWATCLAIALASLVTMTPSGPRSGHYATCRRLDDLDRQPCLYRVQAGLDWSDAAARAGVGIDALRRSNPDLLGPVIPAGALLRLDPPADDRSFDDLIGRPHS